MKMGELEQRLGFDLNSNILPLVEYLKLGKNITISMPDTLCYRDYMDGLVQERRNSSALAMELRLSCTKPLIYCGDRHSSTNLSFLLRR